jgi:uncharacterized protein YdcH (DUF465 family)
MKDEIIFELQKRGADIIIWDSSMNAIDAQVQVSRGVLHIKIYMSLKYLIVREVNREDPRYRSILERFHDVDDVIRILEGEVEYFIEDNIFKLQFREAILPVLPKGKKILRDVHFTIKPDPIILIGSAAVLILILMFLFL